MPYRRPSSNPRLAAAAALAAACLFVGGDVMVKVLVNDYPVVMVAWARMALIVALLGISGGARLGLRLFRPAAWRLQVLRGASGVVGSTMVFLGLRAMPLAECLAVVSIAPVLSNLLSRWWLDEPGDALSWMTALASFAGVLAIVRPGMGVFSIEALYPLSGAIGVAVFLTATRAVSSRDDPRVTAFFGPFVSFLVFSIAMPGNWVTPRSTTHLALFAGVGLLGAIAQVVDTLSYRYGTTHEVAPFGYAGIVMSVAFGWWVFGAVPDIPSLSGMAMILLAGLAALAGSQRR